jgi:hypothetical protein
MTPPTVTSRVRLQVFPTVGGFYRVVVHGPNDLQDPFPDGHPRFAECEVARADTKEEALEVARQWFDSMEVR